MNGTWTQVGCASLSSGTPTPIDCLVAPSKLGRVITISDSSCSTDLAGPGYPQPTGTPCTIKNSQLCLDAPGVTGCYDVRLVGDQLYYCLSTDTCEELVKAS